MESRTLADDIIPGFVIIAIGILSAIILSLIGKYLGLEWVLIFFLIFFLILNFLLKKPYETYGRQSQIDELDEHNYLPEYHRSSSYTYEENLRRSYYMYSHKEQGNMRELMNLFFGGYLLFICALWGDNLMNKRLFIPLFGDYIEIKFIFLCSLGSALVWFWRRSYYDGLAQGYLCGYIDALTKSEPSLLGEDADKRQEKIDS